jgi:hypothetical protein
MGVSKHRQAPKQERKGRLGLMREVAQKILLYWRNGTKTFGLFFAELAEEIW